MGPIIVTAFALLMLGQLVHGTEDQLALSAASTKFSQRLYQEIAVNESSVVYSPYSNLPIVYLQHPFRPDDGIRWLTWRDRPGISVSLNLNAIPSIYTPHAIYHDLIVQLNSLNGVKIKTASAIFVNPECSIRYDFTNHVTRNYLATAGAFSLKDAGGPEKAINDFMARETDNWVTSVLSSGSIKPSTAAVLVNTVFFNGSWETSFDHTRTTRHNFTRTSGAVVQVDMMNGEQIVRVKRDSLNNVDVAELRFRGGRFALYIALPSTPQGITSLENLIARPGKVSQLFDGLNVIYARLRIPKFQIVTLVNLKSSLEKIGIVRAFDPSLADFTGISDSGKVYISDVIHTAKILVQETGTVAAAAEAMDTVRTAAIVQPPKESFIAERPFIFFLRDKQTETILFQGKFSA